MADHESFSRLWKDLDDERAAQRWTRDRLARRISELSGRDCSVKTVHDRMANGRRVSWSDARWYVEALGLDADEWKARWEAAEVRRREPTPPAPAAEPQPPPRRPTVRVLAIAGVSAALVAAAVAAFFSVGAKSDHPRRCSDARRYRVTAYGHVVDRNGRGFDDVAAGDLFVRVDSPDADRLAGRYYGTVPGRNITGFVRIDKLSFDRIIRSCR